MAGKRFLALDAARGVALLAMALFHLLFDLSYFKGWPIDVHSGFWFYFARATAASFIFIAGVSIYISDSRLEEKQRAWHHIRRGARIFSAGILVTAVTLVLFSENAVWFGILHAIGFFVAFLWPLARMGWINLALAAGVFTAWLAASGIAVQFPWLLWLGIPPVGFQSFDYVPFVPWAAPFLLGLWAGRPLLAWMARHEGLGASNFGVGWLAWLGRHSLLFYLAHQPLLVGIVLALA